MEDEKNIIPDQTDTEKDISDADNSQVQAADNAENTSEKVIKTCKKCGTEIEEGQKFCPKCGTPVAEKRVCPNCGNELSDGQAFCPKCGHKAGEAAPAGNTGNIASKAMLKNAVDNGNKNKKKILIVAAVVVIAILVAVLFTQCFSGTMDFNDRYAKYASEEWCTITDDGTALMIDTNPYNIKKHNDSEAFEAIKTVVHDLGFNDSVITLMRETNSLMGMQTERNDDYSVSWSYHPNKGLEVIFSVND